MVQPEIEPAPSTMMLLGVWLRRRCVLAEWHPAWQVTLQAVVAVLLCGALCRFNTGMALWGFNQRAPLFPLVYGARWLHKAGRVVGHTLCSSVGG